MYTVQGALTYEARTSLSTADILADGTLSLEGACPDYYYDRYWDWCSRHYFSGSLSSSYVVSGAWMERSDHIFHRPDNYKYDFGKDQRTYGSIFSKISLALSVLSLTPGLQPWGESEKHVRHYRCVGQAFNSNFTDYLGGVGVYALDGVSYTIPYYEGYPTQTDAIGNPLDVPANGPIIGDRGRPEWPQLFAHIASKYPSGNDWDWTGSLLSRNAKVKLLSFKYTLTEDGAFTIQYSHRIRRWHKDNYKWDQCDIGTTWRFNPKPVFTGEDTTISVHTNALRMGECEIVDVVSNHQHFGYSTPTCGVYGYGGLIRRTRSKLHGVITGKYPDDSEVAGYSLNRYTSRLIEIGVDNISLGRYYAGSAAVSAADAISNYKTVAESNYLESIAELRDIMSLVPKTKALRDFISLVPMGKVFSGVLRLVDFAANTYLLYKFGLLPFRRDIQNFAKDFQEALDKAYGNLGEQNLYGKMTYSFEDGPLEGWFLETRTKVVIGFPKESITIAMLPMSRAGLDPSFANLWDIVPFSFVVDWFTNNDARLELLDSSSTALLSNVKYCVHTYTLTRGLNDLLSSPYYNFDEVEYEIFQRVISRFYPYPAGDQYYDWLGQAGGVPMLIGGALLWTISR